MAAIVSLSVIIKDPRFYSKGNFGVVQKQSILNIWELMLSDFVGCEQADILFHVKQVLADLALGDYDYISFRFFSLTFGSYVLAL